MNVDQGSTVDEPCADDSWRSRKRWSLPLVVLRPGPDAEARTGHHSAGLTLPASYCWAYPLVEQQPDPRWTEGPCHPLWPSSSLSRSAGGAMERHAGRPLPPILRVLPPEVHPNDDEGGGGKSQHDSGDVWDPPNENLDPASLRRGRC